MTETIRIRRDASDLGAAIVPRENTWPRAIRGGMTGAGFALVTAVCAWLGYYVTFSSFAGWDDEGYLLITVKNFSHHGGLYTHMYSTFGPFYYEAFATIFSWLSLTPNSGRVATLVVSLLASLCFGVAVKLLARNLLAGLAAQAGTFVLLILSLVDESMHPSMLVWLLVAVALIALALFARGQRSVGSVLLGATVAAMVLTEVNVGLLAAVATLFAGLVMAPSVGQMRFPRVAAAGLFIATPFLLILVAGGHTSESWAIKYSLIVAMAAAGVVVFTMDRGLQGLVRARDAYRFLLGGGAMGVTIIVVAFISGTHPLDLVRGLFIDPAHFSNAFTIPLSLPLWIEGWGALCLAGAMIYRRYRDRLHSGGLLDTWIHVGIGLLILYCALQETQLAFSTSFTIALPLLCFAAVPTAEATKSERTARVILVALAVLEGLVAYPVAGAQVRWSTLLMVPVGMLCLFDGIRRVPLPFTVVRRSARRVASGVIASAVVFLGLGWFAWVFADDLSVGASGYNASKPLALQGSDLIHLPAAQAETLQSMSRAIRMNCSTLVVFPALDSFYFWTGEEPTAPWFNTYFYTGDARLQKQIARHIEAQNQSRFCVVDNPSWVAFWAQGHVLPQLPMARLVERFERHNGPPQSFNGYRLFVSRSASS